MVNVQAWKEQDKSYHEDSMVVESFERRITHKYRLEHKYFTLDKWVAQLKGNKAGVVLDFGCATGTASVAMAKAGLKVFAVDASSKMLEMVSEKAKAEALDVTCVLGDVEQLPFEDGFFDGIVCLGVLHHLPNIGKGVEEQIRVLKKGGLIFISEPFRHKPWFSYPYHFLVDVIKYMRDMFKPNKLVTLERTLTVADLEMIKAVLKRHDVDYQISYFVYWPNVFGHLPEWVGYPLLRFLNNINRRSQRGDVVFISVKKRE